jgi:hypothetical protein
VPVCFVCISLSFSCIIKRFHLADSSQTIIVPLKEQTSSQNIEFDDDDDDLIANIDFEALKSMKHKDENNEKQV